MAADFRIEDGVRPTIRVRSAQEEAEQRRRLRGLFDAAASHYEWIDRVMSLGWGGWYRRDALQRVGLQAGMRVLDVAVGTGAVARHAARMGGAAGRVVGVDPSAGMLRQARRSLPIPLVQGVAEELPFRAHVFDAVTVGYALRHVVDLRQTFVEYARVLKPGGTL
ncbi:MAG TPA: class I SAM-dependent methyltransferase, partial [Methylomirabilota bacterium]|nr:class I SAM-dependent methyltransferase [Methylomirabilota bacterium]